MVSFSCEGCGDVLTKKKLDAHRGQCRSASFTCLDCMTHFRGTDYRAHTSCISEDQKYQGSLYKEKPTKSSRKSVKISSTDSHAPRKAYVEDAPDPDTGTTISVIDPPPTAPEPPTATPLQPQPPLNVFDYLVDDETPDASKTSLPPALPKAEKDESKISSRLPSLPEIETARSIMQHDPDYEINGYSYGTDPIIPPYTQPRQRPSVEYFTPAPKDLQQDLLYLEDTASRKPTSQKRKRSNPVDELDLTAARRPSQDLDNDAIMADAPAPVLHSGLTGGLGRLLTSKGKFSPSPSYSIDNRSPPSPVKRTKSILTIKDKEKETEKDKSRGRRERGESVMIKPGRRRRTSDESRPRKQHRLHPSEHHHEPERPKHKAIEPPPPSSHAARSVEPHHHHHQQNQSMVVFKSRPELFMSFVTKGPESESGCSMHKALKRYHREKNPGGDKGEDEKELWKGLRMRRNERGEVVLFL